jgi:Fe-S-cluster containining protein
MDVCTLFCTSSHRRIHFVNFHSTNSPPRGIIRFTMNLKVLPSAAPGSPPADSPWYSQGLQFTCAQCGNCCTGGPGYVWISTLEIGRLAKHLKLTPKEVIERYCRKIGGRFSLKEKRRGDLYDCIFLTERKPPAGKGNQLVQTTRVCSIYEVRPLQCRTWPFWKENLKDEKTWEKRGERCHGINRGRKFSLKQINELAEARDWPDKPPTSAKK